MHTMARWSSQSILWIEDALINLLRSRRWASVDLNDSWAELCLTVGLPGPWFSWALLRWTVELLEAIVLEFCGWCWCWCWYCSCSCCCSSVARSTLLLLWLCCRIVSALRFAFAYLLFHSSTRRRYLTLLLASRSWTLLEIGGSMASIEARNHPTE